PGRFMFLGLVLTDLTFWVGLIFVVDSLALIFLVLLHSGKGGGLSDMFGGSIGQTAAGSTVVERNLDRITVIVALVFSFTAIGMGLLLSSPAVSLPSLLTQSHTSEWRNW